VDHYADHYLQAEKKLLALALDDTHKILDDERGGPAELDMEAPLFKELYRIRRSLLATGANAVQKKIILSAIFAVEHYVRSRLIDKDDQRTWHELYFDGPCVTALELLQHKLSNLGNADKLERRKFEERKP
jgi:hypothetical protein